MSEPQVSKGEWAKTKCCLPQEARTPNQPFHLTAARLRFLLNVKGFVWAAASDRRR
jgi:hypothetical protein